MYTLVWSAGFTRSAEKFIKHHPVLKNKFVSVLRDLENNPFQPRLKYHQLGGNLKDIQAVSITYSY
ncbi:MAG: plasmid stabilization protein, partial [Desulfuromonadales bacterium]